MIDNSRLAYAGNQATIVAGGLGAELSAEDPELLAEILVEPLAAPVVERAVSLEGGLELGDAADEIIYGRCAIAVGQRTDGAADVPSPLPDARLG